MGDNTRVADDLRAPLDLEWIPGIDDDELLTKHLPAGIHARPGDGTPFVVIRGRAMIEFDDQDSLVFVRRGTLCSLPRLTSTRWTVSEPLEYLLVTEASVVFREHDDDPARGVTDVNQAHSARPFRPRRHVS